MHIKLLSASVTRSNRENFQEVQSASWQTRRDVKTVRAQTDASSIFKAGRTEGTRGECCASGEAQIIPTNKRLRLQKYLYRHKQRQGSKELMKRQLLLLR